MNVFIISSALFGRIEPFVTGNQKGDPQAAPKFCNPVIPSYGTSAMAIGVVRLSINAGKIPSTIVPAKVR